jgi:hypothetical protein
MKSSQSKHIYINSINIIDLSDECKNIFWIYDTDIENPWV